MKPLLVEQRVDLCTDLVDGSKWTNLHVSENTLLVYKVGFRNAFDAEVLRDARGEVRSVWKGNAKLLQVHTRFRFGVHIICAEEDDLPGGLVFLPGLLQLGCLLLAGFAPGSPEIDDNDLAAQVLKIDFALSLVFVTAVQGQCKVVDLLSGLDGSLLGAPQSHGHDDKQANKKYPDDDLRPEWDAAPRCGSC